MKVSSSTITAASVLPTFVILKYPQKGVVL